MLAGWLIQTDLVLTLVGLLLLITGVVAILAFLATKNAVYAVAGVIILVVRFTNLFDRIVDASWTWLIVAGAVVVTAGGVIGIVAVQGVGRRMAIAAAPLLAALGAFVAVVCVS